MRIFLIILLVFNISVNANIPKNSYVIPTQKNVGIYENRIRKLHENALFHVSLQNRLQVLEEKGNSYQIQDDLGRIGWVQKRFVAVVRGKHLNRFDPADVRGYDDLRSFISIIDNSEFNDSMIKLDRSFKDNLKETVDRETVERIVQ